VDVQVVDEDVAVEVVRAAVEEDEDVEVDVVQSRRRLVAGAA
jgi:hypothetical protein